MGTKFRKCVNSTLNGISKMYEFNVDIKGAIKASREKPFIEKQPFLNRVKDASETLKLEKCKKC